MLDDKDFRENMTNDDTQTQAEQGETVIDPTLIPGYRAEDMPTTTDPPGDPNIDVESVLADIRKMPEGDEPSAIDPPVEELDEKQLMQSMLTAVRELTEEVKQIRIQLETGSYDPAHYPSERPPGSVADADGNASETKPDAQSDQKKSVKHKVFSIMSSVLFYAVIVAMLLGAFLMRSTSKGEPFVIAGYSAANVLTSSMEDVYPKGSLIITKQVDAKELQIGDDITFVVSEDSSITHRIIEIVEDYQGTGERAFKTQGTMNAKPDKDMVAAANVVGKVIFHSKALGDFANFVKANWVILIFVLVVIVGLISFLKWNAKRTVDEEKNLPTVTPSPKKETHTKRRLRKAKEEVE